MRKRLRHRLGHWLLRHVEFCGECFDKAMEEGEPVELVVRRPRMYVQNAPKTWASGSAQNFTVTSTWPLSPENPYQ